MRNGVAFYQTIAFDFVTYNVWCPSGAILLLLVLMICTFGLQPYVPVLMLCTWILLLTSRSEGLLVHNGGLSA